MTGPKKRRNKMRPEYIILHHSLTADGKLVDWQSIRRFHKSWAHKGVILEPSTARQMLADGVRGLKKPWSDIGYHFGIERVGSIYEVLMGRSFYKSGAHCKQQRMNVRAFGVMMAGNFDLAPPCEEQWTLTVNLCANLCKAFKIPFYNIQPHSKYAAYKSCPGTKVDMDKFRSDVHDVNIYP